MEQVVERNRGIGSMAKRYQDQKLEGAYRRYRDWETEMNMTDSSWENRLEFEEWEFFGRLSTLQLEMTYWTTFRAFLGKIMRPELVGVAIREAENTSDDLETRKKVGKMMDRVIALGGVRAMNRDESVIAKVKTLKFSNFRQKSHVG